jgi:hypothetical protein
MTPPQPNTVAPAADIINENMNETIMKRMVPSRRIHKKWWRWGWWWWYQQSRYKKKELIDLLLNQTRNKGFQHDSYVTCMFCGWISAIIHRDII